MKQPWKRVDMERSELIKKIKALVEETNEFIKQKEFLLVYENYTNIAKLCKEIGDEKNANSYTEAANKFKQRADVVKHEKELRDAINKALALAKIDLFPNARAPYSILPRE